MQGVSALQRRGAGTPLQTMPSKQTGMAYSGILKKAGFPVKYICVLWANSVQVISLCSVVWCLWTTLTRQYSYAMLCQHGW